MPDRIYAVLGQTSAPNARACWVVMLYAGQQAAEAHADAANAEANRINNTLKRIAMLRGGPAEPTLRALPKPSCHRAHLATLRALPKPSCHRARLATLRALPKPSSHRRGVPSVAAPVRPSSSFSIGKSPCPPLQP